MSTPASAPLPAPGLASAAAPADPPLAAPAASRLSGRTIGLLAALVTVLIWTSFIVIARASTDPARGALLLPLDMGMARICGAFAVLAPWGWWLTRHDRAAGVVGAYSFGGLSPLPFRMTVLIGFFGGALYATFAYSGFAFAPAAHGSVLLPGGLPLWTSLLAVLVLGERLHRERVAGLVLIVGGGLLVGGASLLHALDGSGVWRGDLLFMGASMCWSVYSVLVRRHSLDAVRATIAITVFAFCTYVPIYGALVLAQWLPSHLGQAGWPFVLFQMVYQGVGTVAISGITFTTMIRHYGPVRSTMITALVPGLSALSAALLLGEALPWNVLAGLALVSAGILFGVRQKR